MPWCPNCKNEYVEGVTVCVDCGCKLVEALNEKGFLVCDGSREEMELLADFMEKNHFSDLKVEASDRDGIYELFVNEAQAKKASDAAGVFFKELAKRQKPDPGENAAIQETDGEAFSGSADGALEAEAMEDGEAEEMAGAVRPDETMAQAGSAGVYEDSAKKAEEFKSGAYTLLVVGVLGLAALGALLSGALPIRLNPSSQWMTCLVMGALFLIFIVMGVLSLQSSKKLARKADQENAWKQDMLVFCREKLDTAALDEEAQLLEADPEEVIYFKRTEQLKNRLTEAFPDAGGEYLDYFVDEIYPEVFGK